MYVDDLTLLQARDWERKLKTDLCSTALSGARREQAQMDLQDVQTHIATLTG